MPEFALQLPQPVRERQRRPAPQSPNSLAGQLFGRWMVKDKFELTKKGEKKWLCRCSCGTERYVLERSLRYGGSLSCGCLRREALSEAISHDLTGQTFGDLTALGPSDSYHKNGGIWWNCQCACGSTCEVPATLLVNGRKTHCGCRTPEKNYAFTDIAGQRFGRLTALYKTEKRSGKGGVVWHCQCDCGNETDVPYNTLVYSNQQSCGCRKKEHDQILGTLQTRVDGTSLDIIRSKKIPSNSTTGVRGVYLIKGKYVAKVNFQKKAYYLGSYSTMDEAVAARKDAEEALYESTILFYKKWQEMAEKDPAWAEENPVQIFVTKTDGGLCASFLPDLK